LSHCALSYGFRRERNAVSLPSTPDPRSLSMVNENMGTDCAESEALKYNCPSFFSAWRRSDDLRLKLT
jgi:hypothetical protein